MGVKLYEKQTEELARLKTLINEAKTEFRIQKFVRPAFQSSLSPDGLIDPEYPFTYEDDYKKQIAQCKKDIDLILRSKYLPAISRFSFAKNKEKRFEYRCGAIENTQPCVDERGQIVPGVLNQKGIQEQICDILEGGKEAFELRRNKYSSAL